jgi:LmbE family N-acetylglucosaminyl deacetylase
MKRRTCLRGALILAPHPDDETLGCGGLIAELARLRRPFVVVIATDGEASHPGSPAWPARRRAALRRREAASAVLRLGGARRHLRFLNFPDGAMPAAGQALHQAATRLLAWMARLRLPQLVAPAQAEAHPDHRACNALARAMGRRRRLSLLEYAVWGTLPPGALCRLPVLRHVARRKAALERHHSQLGRGPRGLGPGFSVPDELRAMTRRGAELFRLAEPGR